MFILLERPWTSQSIGMLARKDGQYKRPVVGDIVDFRVEDYMPQQVLVDLLGTNMIGRLPDIPEIGQVNKYFSSAFSDVNIVDKQSCLIRASI